MANADVSGPRTGLRLRPSERLGYQILVKLAFVLCLGFVLFERLASRRRPTSAASGRRNGSVIAEARAAAHAAIGYAYLA